eukprot:COSAG01_NODE_1040_length_11961_cov_22.590794_5_plen_113_part_00
MSSSLLLLLLLLLLLATGSERLAVAVASCGSMACRLSMASRASITAGTQQGARPVAGWLVAWLHGGSQAQTRSSRRPPSGDPAHETDRKILKSAQQGYQNPLLESLTAASAA